METRTHRAEVDDWADLWPLLQGMGTVVSEEESRRTFATVLADERWLLVLADRQGRCAARLHHMYVAVDQRQPGVGRLLMNAVTDWAGSRVSYLQCRSATSHLTSATRA